MSINNLIADYLFKEVGASQALKLEDESESFIASIPALAIAPIASPFGKRREQKTFPLYRRATTPPDQRGIVGDFEEQEPESDSYDKVTIENLPENLTSLFGITGKEGKVDIFGKSYQVGPEPVRATFGVPQVFNPGYALNQFASLSGSPVSAGYVGEKNLQQLQYAQTMAALGYDNYGVGLVNGQVVAVSPQGLLGTYPNISPQDHDTIVQKFSGKSGPMKAGVEAFKNLSVGTPKTEGMIRFETEVMKAKGIPDNLKSQLLGFDYNMSNLDKIMAQRGETRPMDVIKQSLGGYRDVVSGKQFLQDTRTTKDIREGVNPELLGLEDTLPQQGPPLPSIEITGDGVEGETYGDLGGAYSGDLGSLYTAYGGRIGMSNGGFTSKTETIKGVGLIKPEQTFMDTDVVDDRFEFDAEEGDYIVNGPASDMKKSGINLLINYAIDKLKEEGVDIRVGNPKIKDRDKVPLVTASSETYIPRVIAEKIGYPILEAINDMGKPEVERLKNKLNDQPSDKSKYEAYNGGFLFKDGRKGTMLFNQPPINVTNPNVDKAYDVFVPGLSDQPLAMTPDDVRFFGDFKFGDIKKAIRKTEIQGFENNPYIFTGSKAKGGKGSSAFGPMQITYSLLKDFIDRSEEYSTLTKEQQNYVKALLVQGEDKVNKELYGVIKRGPKNKRVDYTPIEIFGKKAKNLKPLGIGVLDPELHKKHYNAVADAVLLHKLGDHDTIEKALASYGEGAEYSEKVLNDLLDLTQTGFLSKPVKSK